MPGETRARRSVPAWSVIRANTGSGDPGERITRYVWGGAARSMDRGQIRRRPTLGLTAAATTAVFATGAGPGVTAAATTAVFATGARMTPTLPTRVGLSGIVSLLRS